jgi:hypothetical protein
VGFCWLLPSYFTPSALILLFFYFGSWVKDNSFIKTVLLISTVSLVIIEIIHEVIANLYMGFLYYYREYATINIISNKNALPTHNNKNRKFFLTLWIQVFVFTISTGCIMYSYYDIMNIPLTDNKYIYSIIDHIGKFIQLENSSDVKIYHFYILISIIIIIWFIRFSKNMYSIHSNHLRNIYEQ